MKTLRNLFLVLALSSTYVLADGHTGSGNRCDTCEPPPCTENCLDGGAYTASAGGETVLESGLEEESTTLEEWSEWFFELIGYGEF